MGVVNSYRDLIVWQKAMDLAAAMYRLTEFFPQKEQFGLTSQARRAAVSIAANIAEGQGRGATQDYIRFLRIARGSAQELETLLLLMPRVGYLTNEAITPAIDLCGDITRMLAGLQRSLEAQG